MMKNTLFRVLLIVGITLLFTAVLTTISCGQAQENSQPTQKEKVVRRIKIRHADPLFILLMINGKNPTKPEYSTDIFGRGNMNGSGNNGNGPKSGR